MKNIMTCVICENELINLRKYHIDEKFVNYNFKQCSNCGIVMSSPFKSAESSHYVGMETYKERWEFKYCLEFLKLKKHSKILEVGCGEGFFAEHALRRNLDYIGLDFNKDAIETCITKFNKGIFLNKDLNIYFSNNSTKLDAFFMFHVLEHLDRPMKFLKLVKDNLNKNGKIIISVPSQNRISLYYNVRENWDNPPHHLTRWYESSINVLAKELDMNLVLLKYEPLNFKTFLEFNLFNKIFLKEIKYKYTKSLAKRFFLPLLYINFLFKKKFFSDQALLFILEKK